MFRIDDPSAATSMPTPEAAGTEGYWTEGNPTTGVAATLERASWFNMMQEELRSIVVAGGISPSKTAYSQVLQALQAMYGAGRPGHAYTTNDWAPLPGGLIIQWGTITPAAYTTPNNFQTTAFTFPIAFPNGCFTCVGTLRSGSSATSFSNLSFEAQTKNGANAIYASGANNIPLFNYITIGS